MSWLNDRGVRTLWKAAKAYFATEESIKMNIKPEDIGAEVRGTAEAKVSAHEESTTAHADLRELVANLRNRLNTLADSDDTTLDQISELVAYIKANRGLIEGVTTNKINVSDIINNLTTNVSNKPLSAAQGVVLKDLINTLSEVFNNHSSDKVAHITATEREAWNAKAEKEDVPTKYSDLTDDIGYLKEEKFNGHKHVWKDIIDRAFGEFPADKGIDTVISNDIVHGKYVKVSDAIPTLAEVQQGGTVTYYNVAEGEITGELVTANFPEGDYRVTESTNGIRINYDGVPIVLISYNGNPTFGAVTFPVVTEAGVYFDAGLYRCMHSLTINNYTGFEVIKTLPKKYLPEDIGAVKTVNNTAPDEAGNINININIEENKAFTLVHSNILKWEGNIAGLPSIGNADFKIYDEAPTVAEASEGGYFKYEENGEIKTFTFTADGVSQWNDDIFAIYGDDFGEIIVVSKDGASHNSLTDLEKGIYISSYSGKHISEIMFNGYEFATQVLKGECLPKHEHSWKDIKDPLFGEVKSGNGDTIVSDKVVYGNYHKVSDAVPTLADINKGVQLTYHWVEDGKVSRNSRTFDSIDQYYRVSESTAGIVITYDGTPLVVISLTGSSAIGGWTFEGITEAGTYFRQDSYYCTYSLTINEYTGYPYMFEKIPERYLPEDTGTGGGGGVSSWNDLTDKPFYETTVMSDTLPWDGNTEGLDSVMGMLYLVSGAVPTLEDLQNGGTLTGTNPDESMSIEFTADMIMDAETAGMGTNIIMIQGDALPIFIATQDGATLIEGDISIPFEKAGIYFPNMEGSYISSFTINNYQFEDVEITPIDIKYLPKQLQIGETTETIMGDTLTWDGDMTGKPVVSLDMGEDGVMNFCKVSDAVPTIEDLANGGSATVPGLGVQEFTSDVFSIGEGYMYAEMAVIVSEPNVTVEEIGLTFPETGLWLIQQTLEGMSMYVGEVKINGYANFKNTVTIIKKLDKKFYDGADVSSYLVEEFGDTLTWDLNLDGRIKYNDTPPTTYDLGTAAIHISDKAPTMQDLSQGGSITLDTSSEPSEFTANDFQVTPTGLMLGGGIMGIAIVHTPNTQYPKVGTYFIVMYADEGIAMNVIERFTINGYNGFSKYRLAHPYYTEVRSVAGQTPNKKGDIDISSLLTESEDKVKEYCESHLKRYKDIVITESTDDSGATVYTADTEFTDMMNLVKYQDVRLKYNDRIYHPMDMGLSLAEEGIFYRNIYRFVNTYMVGTTLKISQFAWKRPSSLEEDTTIKLTYSEKSI